MESCTLTESPITRTSLADSVYEKLLEAILSGQLKNGTILATVALSQQLGVSRTPVQEALHRLAADGLVECETGRRARVASFSHEDVVEIYGLREVLEGEAAARAAERLAAEEIESMRHHFLMLLEAAQEDRSAGWCDRALDRDLWFHDRIAAASGNRRLADDIRRYRLLVRSFCRIAGTVENLQQAIREHLLVVNALADRDPIAARAAMIQHVRSRLDGVIEKLIIGAASAAEDEIADA